MKIAVVAHYSRSRQAEALASSLGASVFMDHEGNGAAWNHRRALAWAAEQQERVIVLEDDAQPVAGFLAAAQRVIDRFPDDLVSFYLGTGRPPQYQAVIRERMEDLDRRGGDSLVMPDLLHGVAYSVPPERVALVLQRMSHTLPADFAIGRAWTSFTGRQVVYPVPSLVDHADGSSVEHHPDGKPRTEPRRAWRLPSCVGPEHCKPAFPEEGKSWM